MIDTLNSPNFGAEGASDLGAERVELGETELAGEAKDAAGSSNLNPDSPGNQELRDGSESVGEVVTEMTNVAPAPVNPPSETRPF